VQAVGDDLEEIVQRENSSIHSNLHN
jgi:hypothetical protein